MEEEYDMVSAVQVEKEIGLYIPKQFDMDKLMSIEKDERNVLIKLMTSQTSMFHEETKTTLESYGLIIDQREGSINNLLK